MRMNFEDCLMWLSRFKKSLDLGSLNQVDLIIEEKLIVEIKSIEASALVHAKQLLTHLRLTNIKLGLLINFKRTT